MLFSSLLEFCEEDTLLLSSSFIEDTILSAFLFTTLAEDSEIFFSLFSSLLKTLSINLTSKLLFVVKFRFFPILKSIITATIEIIIILIIFIFFNSGYLPLIFSCSIQPVKYKTLKFHLWFLPQVSFYLFIWISLLTLKK